MVYMKKKNLNFKETYLETHNQLKDHSCNSQKLRLNNLKLPTFFAKQKILLTLPTSNFVHDFKILITKVSSFGYNSIKAILFRNGC